MRNPTRATPEPPELDVEDVAHDVYETIERCASLSRSIAAMLYHNDDSGDVDDARLGCQGIAALLDEAAHKAGELHRVLNENKKRADKP